MSSDSGYPSHPKLEEALHHCPGNEHQARVAFRVYMDLCEVKTWRDVELHHCKALNIMFVSGRKGRGEYREIFLPVEISTQMSHEQILTYFTHVKLDTKETKSITLAVCDVDSSIVYYKISNELKPPDPPEVSDEKKRERHKKFQQKRQHLFNQTELFRIERENDSVEASNVEEDICNVQEKPLTE